MTLTGAGVVATHATLASPTWYIDQGDKYVLRLWLPGTITVTDELPWTVSVTATLEKDYGFVVTDLELKQKPGGPGINAAELRKVPLADLLDEMLARPEVGVMVDRDDVDKPPQRQRVIEMPIPPAYLREARRVTRTQRGRPAKPVETRKHLERVAAVARKAPPRELLATLKTVLGISEGAAKKALREARAAGLLEHSTRSAGGQR
jgi:hypothetical protein